MSEPSLPGTVLASELARIIDDAAIFAGRDSTLPMLNAIRFESTAENLLAVSTDRFVMGASIANYHQAGGTEFDITLKLSQAQMVAKIAKSTKAAFTDVTLTVTDENVTFDFTSGESLTVPNLAGSLEFPDWRKFITSRTEDAEGSTKVIGFNPVYLAKFSRVTNARQLTMKTTGPDKPMLVSIGDSFIGLVMPVRLPGGAEAAWESPEWLKKPAAKPKARARKKPAAKKAAA